MTFVKAISSVWWSTQREECQKLIFIKNWCDIIEYRNDCIRSEDGMLNLPQ